MSGSDAGQGKPPAGWYPDPDKPGNRRWWDGLAWTDFSEPIGSPGQAPGQAPGQGGPQGPPGGPPGAYTGGGPAFAAAGPGHPGPAPAIDTWLWQSIVATVLCCLPLGIVGIVFSSQAQTEISNRNYALAQEKAKQAKTFTLVSAGLGLLLYLGFFSLGFLPLFFAV